MEQVVVVGGGLAGLVAARLEQERGAQVTLVEQAPQLGGLLASVPGPEGVWFDQGTHLLSATGNPELDALRYGGLDPAEWVTFEVARAGNYFRGRMNPDSKYLDATALPPELHQRGLAELLETRPFDVAECAHLGERFVKHFGPTYAEHIGAPTMRKQFGCGPEELDPRCPFALHQVMVGSPEMSRELKRSPLYDGKVAAAAQGEGGQRRRYYYPRRGGVGRWVDGFARALRDAGVGVLTSESVASLKLEGHRVREATLASGTRLPCDRLYWTVPAALLLQHLGVANPAARPQLRPIGIYHFVYDRPPLERTHYITIWDEDLATFRVTLYPNLRAGDGPPAGPWNLTVEVIGEPGTDFATLAPRLHEELVHMGIVAREGRLTHSQHQVVAAGFPTFSPALVAGVARQGELVSEHARNAVLLGRAKCLPFFMNDVLLETFERITAADRAEAAVGVGPGRG